MASGMARLKNLTLFADIPDPVSLALSRQDLAEILAKKKPPALKQVVG